MLYYAQVFNYVTLPGSIMFYHVDLPVCSLDLQLHSYTITFHLVPYLHIFLFMTALCSRCGHYIFATCKIQFASTVQVLRSRILAALLHGTPAAGLSQTLRRGTKNGISFTELSQRAPPTFRWAAITFGIGPHSSCTFIVIHWSSL